MLLLVSLESLKVIIGIWGYWPAGVIPSRIETIAIAEAPTKGVTLLSLLVISCLLLWLLLDILNIKAPTLLLLMLSCTL